MGDSTPRPSRLQRCAPTSAQRCAENSDPSWRGAPATTNRPACPAKLCVARASELLTDPVAWLKFQHLHARFRQQRRHERVVEVIRAITHLRDARSCENL